MKQFTGRVVLATLAAAALSCCTNDAAPLSDRSSGQPLTAVAAQTQSQPPSASTARRTCPDTAPLQVPSRQRSGTATSIVPDLPTSLLACRYHGFNQPEAQGTLATSAELAPGEIAARLNAIPIPPADAPLPNCPADFGEKYMLWFGYSDGSALLVSVDGAGCNYVNNGDLLVPFGGDVLPLLEGPLGHEDQ
jgi:hypothetical protein